MPLLHHRNPEHPMQRRLNASASSQKPRVSYVEKVICSPFIIEIQLIVCRESYVLLNHRNEYIFRESYVLFNHRNEYIFRESYVLLNHRNHRDRLKLFQNTQSKKNRRLEYYDMLNTYRRIGGTWRRPAQD